MQKGIDYTGISVVYFCHDGNGNVLMNKRGERCRDEQGVWDIGAGGVEHLEQVEATLHKEIREEYCTDVLAYEFLGFRDVHRELPDGTKTHWVALDFKVLIDREKATNGEPHKFEKIAWFPLGELPDELHSQLPRFLEKYREKL